MAFRNIPGVEIVSVDRFNLLQLAPGGHLGRFIVWTKSAFEKLDAIFGTHEKNSLLKKDYILPRNIMGNLDLARIINSEIQSVVRPTKTVIKRRVLKKNPLKNLGALLKLNPYAKTARRMELLVQERQSKAKAEKLQSKRSQLKVLHFDHTMVAFVFVAPCSSVAARGEGVDQEAGCCLVQEHGFRFRVHRVQELHQVVGCLPVKRSVIVHFYTYWTCSKAFLLVLLVLEERVIYANAVRAHF